jgi:uncharacterized protein
LIWEVETNITCSGSPVTEVLVPMRLLAAVLLLIASLNTAGANEAAVGAALARGDHAEAARLVRPAAEAGDRDAQTLLGGLHLVGQGVERDLALAAAWFRKAADQGQPFAQYNLGLMTFRGEGVTADFSAAARFYGRAAEQGVAPAMTQLGLMYLRGIGVEASVTKAAALFESAAERGDPEAQNQLGVLLATGTGVGRNVRAAYKWFRLAERGGVATSSGNAKIAALDLTAAELAAVAKEVEAWRPLTN